MTEPQDSNDEPMAADDPTRLYPRAPAEPPTESTTGQWPAAPGPFSTSPVAGSSDTPPGPASESGPARYPSAANPGYPPYQPYQQGQSNQGAQGGQPGQAGPQGGPSYPPYGAQPWQQQPGPAAPGGGHLGNGYSAQPGGYPPGYQPPQNPGSGQWRSGPSASGQWGAPATYWTPPGHRAKRRHGAGAIAAATAAVVVVAGFAGLGVGRAVWDNSSSNTASAANAGGTTVPVFGGSSTGSGSNGSSGSSGSSGFGGSSGSSGPSGSSGITGSSGSSSSTASGAPANTVAIAAKVSPGLVDINTVLGYAQAEAAGTGIVLTSSGVILTNNHVISGATKITVTDVGNKKTYTATVVGYDRTDDIAVLQIHASGLQTATLSSSASLAVGQAIVGIGNAEGAGGTPSYAGGSITALGQSITASDEGTGTSEQLTGLIQTNANIEPGDSGGALANAAGQVIGIDTAASSGFSFNQEGTEGFAIPITKALTIVQEIRGGSASSTVHLGATPFLGIGLSASGSSADGDATVGTTISTIIAGQPAQKAGIVAGDTITSIAGTAVSTGNQLTTVIDEHHPGDKVSVTWTDAAGASHSASITLDVGPAN